MTEVIDPKYVDADNPEGIPRSWGVSIAWLSELYQPGSGAVPEDDDVPGQDPSWRASRDIWDHPQWRAWLKAHMVRGDVFMCLRIDDVPKKRFSSSHSRKHGEDNFYLKVPVQEFLSRDERAVVRIAKCELFGYAAKKLGLPPPPPVLE